MSEESKDLEAAADQFLIMLKEKDKKTQRKLLEIFIYRFVRSYKQSKRELRRFHSTLLPREFFTELSSATAEKIRDALITVQKIDPREQTEKEIADVLGIALGYFLAAVEYGITNQYFFQKHIREDFLHPRDILTNTRAIASKLQELGKKVSSIFIRNRVLKIAREHQASLRPEQQKLIAQIAAIFST